MGPFCEMTRTRVPSGSPIYMTSDSPSDTEITSSEDFEAALGDLLRAALNNGVDPEGAWEYRTNNNGTDWEVMVLELQNHDDSE
jgi:hypothetical protein